MNIISLTSYPARIGGIHVVLESLLAQTVRADSVILCLSLLEFPRADEDLPESLKNLLAKGVELLWCEGDLKPHKKYFHTLQKYPEATVITVDDDLIYPPTLVAELLEAHGRFPDCICTHWARLMTFGPDGELMPYVGWPLAEKLFAGVPMLPLLPLSGSGTLYPPGSVPSETFDAQAITRCALCGDDIWVRLMTLARHRPVVAVHGEGEIVAVSEQRASGLFDLNERFNDVMARRTAEHIRQQMGVDVLGVARDARPDRSGEAGRRLELAHSDLLIRHRKLLNAKRKLERIEFSRSYRLGRFLTWPLRQLVAACKGRK